MTLELKNISKHVGAETHIHDTSLKLQEGAFNILLGTTLSGKTTLMRIMAGLEKPSHGEVWFDGQNVTGQAVQQRNVAFVYQQFINYPNYTVFENVASPLRVLGKNKTEIKNAVNKVTDLLKLTPFLKRMPDELSGGQQQRLALARALVKEAKLVLLDEPLANLDYKLREELREELPKLFAATGATVIYASSEPGEALLLGGYTAALHEGSVVQFGVTSELYQQPTTLKCAKVFSEPPINTIQVRKLGDRIHLNDSVQWHMKTRVESLLDGEYTLGVRPHHFNLQARDQFSVPITGSVAISEISGSESIVHINIGQHMWCSHNPGVQQLDIGAEVEFYIQTDRCLLFDANGQRVM